MSHKIVERENEESSIHKLAAQREIYSCAKRVFVLQSFISVILLVAFSFAQLVFSYIDLTLVIATVSLFAVIIDNWLEQCINHLKENAARIQELFDTYVLNMSWNSVLCLEKPEYDEIYNYVQKFKTSNDFSGLINWYEPEINKVPSQTAKLICQKTNCNYDKCVRKKYNTVILWTGIITFSLIIIFTIFSGLTLAKILLTIFFPSLPIIQWTIKNICSNNQTILKLEQLNNLINHNWKLVKQGHSVDDFILRQIQDGIYLNRKSSSLIPDFVYNKMRRKLEVQTHYTVNQLVDEILNNK